MKFNEIFKWFKRQKESYSLVMIVGKFVLNVFKDKIDNIYDWLQFRVFNFNVLLIVCFGID